jgi:NAD-dependent deacetylase
MQRIPLGESTRLIVLTGAGVSAESGIPTFRDAGGLWEGHDIHDVASPEGFERDPATVWRFYSQRRRDGAAVSPNGAHRALARVEAQLGDRLLLVTQNVDGLHTVAGSQRVLEIHGNLMRTRCHDCPRDAFDDRATYFDEVPRCAECGGRLRPDIVWFGEALPFEARPRIEHFLVQGMQATTASGGADVVFLAAGTSGLVFPAANLVHEVAAIGGTTYLANLDSPTNAHAFDHVVLGPASQVLPALLGVSGE